MNDIGRAAAISSVDLKERLDSVNMRISEACRRAFRSPSEITLVGVTKTIQPDVIAGAIELGLRVLGENRVQEAAGKISELSGITSEKGVSWHMIGHLQSNKARRAIELFDFIESVDSLKLAERLNSIAGELGKLLPVLLEVNIGEEDSKAGLDVSELIRVCEGVSALDNLELCGLMTVPPYFDDVEQVRPYFRKLRELRDEVLRAGTADADFTHLSMGMSHDFEVAIEEGATIVRIGTSIFGPREWN